MVRRLLPVVAMIFVFLLFSGCRFEVDWTKTPCATDQNCPVGYVCVVVDDAGHCASSPVDGDDDDVTVQDDDDVTVQDDDDDDDDVTVPDDDDQVDDDDDTAPAELTCSDYCTASEQGPCMLWQGNDKQCLLACENALIGRGTSPSGASDDYANSLGCRVQHLNGAGDPSDPGCQYGGLLGGSNNLGYRCVDDLVWPLCMQRMNQCGSELWGFPTCATPAHDSFDQCLESFANWEGSTNPDQQLEPFGDSLACRLFHVASVGTVNQDTPWNTLDNCVDSSVASCDCVDDLAQRSASCPTVVDYVKSPSPPFHRLWTVPGPLDWSVSVGSTLAASTVIGNTLSVVADVDVYVDLHAEYAESISILLRSPQGTQVYLFNQAGSGCPSCDASFMGTVFDDSNPSLWVQIGTNAGGHSSCPPYTGRHATVDYATTGLNAFNGENPSGTWDLTVVNAPSSAGSAPARLDAWRVVVNGGDNCN